LLARSGREAPGYDSFWHVFIARQRLDQSFWLEAFLDAHPPFYYLLLKLDVALFGPTPLSYRVISIASMAVAIVALGRVTLRLTRSALPSVAAAAAFGLSATSVEMGLEVRQYAIFLALMAPALGAYLDWLGAAAERPRLSPRVQFTMCTTLALLVHYATFFFLGATIVALPVLFFLHPRWRARLVDEWASHRRAVVCMFGVPVMVATIAYLVQVQGWAHRLHHVSAFTYDRSSSMESIATFLVRTSRSLAVLFLPGQWDEKSFMGALLGLAILALIVFLVLRRRGRAEPGAVVLALVAFLLVENVVAALAGRYPYGGERRHEIFFFPFLVALLFTALDRLRRALVGGRVLLCATGVAICAAVATISYIDLKRYPITLHERIGQAEMNRFRSHVPDPKAIMVDQFTLILFFGLHDDWSWQLVWENPMAGIWQVWELSQGGRRLFLCRDRRWQIEMSAPRTYEDVAQCLQQTGAPDVAIFRMQQLGFAPGPWISRTTELAGILGPPAGVRPEAVFVDAGQHVYARFALAGR
jgi:hypothetical protein